MHFRKGAISSFTRAAVIAFAQGGPGAVYRGADAIGFVARRAFAIDQSKQLGFVEHQRGDCLWCLWCLWCLQRSHQRHGAAVRMPTSACGVPARARTGAISALPRHAGSGAAPAARKTVLAQCLWRSCRQA